MSRAAAIQMASGPQVADNLAEAARLIARAAAEGAVLAVLPENFALMGRHETDKLAVAESPGEGPIQDFLAREAQRHGIWLVGGTLPLRVEGDKDHVYASCLVYNADGRQAARYDKIHLFDVHIPDRDEHYAESRSIAPGSGITVVDTPIGRLGLAVCYDLRFPELFRRLVDEKAEIISLPSAFTAATGQAHWEVLVRARAIENFCYVIAPGQGGRHASGRETYGNSMIVDPWGNVLQRLATGAGVAVAEIDLERLRETRERFPSLQHRRLNARTE